jgi:outer membrane protein assembly factor BamB
MASEAMQQRRSTTERTISDFVFVGFNSRVVALDRYSGEMVWDWKSPEGSGFVSILIDGDRLIVSVMGYTYCLDPLYGQEVWRNPLKGYGVGVACVTSVNAAGPAGSAAAMAQQHANEAAAAAIAANTAATAG